MVNNVSLPRGDDIDKALMFFRDRYEQAMQADYFLEATTGISGKNIAKHHLVNVGSHFSSMLRAQDAEIRDFELREIEKHLRLAVLESYGVVIDYYVDTFDRSFKVYRILIPPIRWLPGFSAAPKIRDLEGKLWAVRRKRVEGKACLDVIAPPDKWETGVKCYLSAITLLKDAVSDMTSHIRFSAYIFLAIAGVGIPIFLIL